MSITSFIMIFYTLLIISIVSTNGAVVDDVCCQTKNPQRCDGAVVDDVCCQTKNPQRCFEALGGPGSRTSELQGLGLTGLETGVRGAQTCERTFLRLTNSSPRPELRPSFIQCEKLYQDALETLTAARQVAQIFGRWDQVVPNVVPVFGDVDQCEDLFTGSSPVHLLGDTVRVAAEAIIVIAKKLSHQY